MDYRGKLYALAHALNAHLHISSEPEEAWRVERLLRLAPSYPIPPSDIVRGYLISGEADVKTRDVWINGWGDNDDDHALVVGLHELGHIATTGPIQLTPYEDMMLKLNIGPTPTAILNAELDAWLWTSKHLTPELLPVALERATFALTSYGASREQIAAVHDEMRAAAQSHQYVT